MVYEKCLWVLSQVSQEHYLPQMGLVFTLSLVSVELATQSPTFFTNLQLALHMILSLVSDTTRNRPWVTGEVQLAPRSFAFAFLCSLVVRFISLFGNLYGSDILFING